jgi:alpha-beta hydrolase superfamily lysophospholipase
MNDITYITIKQKDGYITKLTQYICPVKPKASILILHGMAEHQDRYQTFAKYLTGQGFDVFTYNHRGHGTDKKLNDLGFISAENGYHLLVEDAIAISEQIDKTNRSNRFFLLGHSMGSLIARNVIQTYDKYTGVILSGTTYPSALLTVSGLCVSSIITKFNGPKHISPYLNNLMFGGNKYTSLGSRTTFDWLSRSNPVVGAYMNDPYCGFICTASFYHDLLKLVSFSTKKNSISQTKKDLPIYVISGEKDPVGGYGKEITKFLSVLKKCEFTNVSSKLYPECRHEILNELNHDEVFDDIQKWINKRV